MLAGERLDGGSGVHVADGNDLAGIHNGGEFIPAGLHLANISHVGHRAASVQVRQHYNLVLTAENVRAFRHEMDATEDNVAGVGFGGLKREFQGVAAKISEFDDFVALVVMAEDDHVFAQADFSCGNAVVEGVIGNEQVGVKVAADTRLDFRRANGGRRIRADEGAASRNGNEVAHGWYSLYLEVVFLRSLNRCETLFSHIQGDCPLPPNKDHGSRWGHKTGLIDAVPFFLFVDHRADIGGQIVVRGALAKEGTEVVVLLAK